MEIDRKNEDYAKKEMKLKEREERLQQKADSVELKIQEAGDVMKMKREAEKMMGEARSIKEEYEMKANKLKAAL